MYINEAAPAMVQPLLFYQKSEELEESPRSRKISEEWYQKGQGVGKSKANQSRKGEKGRREDELAYPLKGPLKGQCTARYISFESLLFCLKICYLDLSI